MSSTDTVTFSNNTGPVTVTSNNTSIATAAVSGNNINITGVGAGSTTITVNVGANGDYGATSRTISVNVSQAQQPQTEEEIILNTTEHKWQYVNLFPYSFHAGSTVEIGNNLHIMGGSKYDDAPNNSEIDYYKNETTNHYYSSNLSSWTKSTDLPVGANNIIYFNNKLYLIGSAARPNGIYVSSDNGQSWSELQLQQNDCHFGSSNRLTIYNNSIHVFGPNNVNYNTNHYISSDGINWTKTTTPADFGYCSFCVYNNKIHVLTTDKKHYSYSNSGWTFVNNLPSDISSSPTYNSNMVVYNNVVFLLAGNYLYKTQDFVNWVKVTGNTDINNNNLLNQDALFIYKNDLYARGFTISGDDISFSNNNKNIYKLIIQ